MLGNTNTSTSGSITLPTPTPTPHVVPDGWHVSNAHYTRQITLPEAPARTLGIAIYCHHPEHVTFELMLDGLSLATTQIPRDDRGDNASEYRATALGWAMSVLTVYVVQPLSQMRAELAALRIARTPPQTEIALAVPAAPPVSRRRSRKTRRAATKGRR